MDNFLLTDGLYAGVVEGRVEKVGNLLPDVGVGWRVQKRVVVWKKLSSVCWALAEGSRMIGLPSWSDKVTGK